MSVIEPRIALWPASGVVVRCGGLELRWIDDDLLADLAELAGRGIHDEALMPFAAPWSRGSALEVARSVIAFQWAARSHVGPVGRFVLELGVLLDGVPVGIQGASGSDWRVTRTLETGSWLGREFQGQGVGTRMRAAFVGALFDGLGAQRLTSGAFADNPSSAAVSRKVGYEPNGVDVVDREGEPASLHRFVLTRERWQEQRSLHRELLGADVQLTGFEALREQLEAE